MVEVQHFTEYPPLWQEARDTDPAAVLSGRDMADSRKVYVRLPGKGNSNSHGVRPVHLIITMIKWIWTRKMSIKNCFSG